MALITCPECGHRISEYSDKCIYCGCPMSVIKKLLKSSGKQSVQKDEPILIEAIVDYESEIDNKAFFASKTKHEQKIMADTYAELKAIIPDLKNKSLVHRFRFEIQYKNKKFAIAWFVGNTKKKLRLRWYQDIDRQKGIKSMAFSRLKPKIIAKKIGAIYNEAQLARHIFNSNLDKPAKKIAKHTSYNDFLSSKNVQEICKMDQLFDCLKNRIPELTKQNKKSIYRFGIIRNSEFFSLCWFSGLTSEDFVLKWYLSPALREGQQTCKFENINILEKATEIADIFDKSFLLTDSQTIDQLDTNESATSDPLIFTQLVNKFKNKTVSGSSEVKTLCNNIYDFVIKVAEVKYRFNGYFTVKEGNLYGYNFVFPRIGIKETRWFCRCYLVEEIIKTIRNYEEWFNNTIISDAVIFRKKLLDSEGIESNEIKNSDGLTANINNVPTETIEKLLNNYRKLGIS